MNKDTHTRARVRVRLHDVPKPKRKKAKANRLLLTEERVAALPAQRKDYLVWDGGGRGAVPGLHVHVLPSGTKTYRYSFRFPGDEQAKSFKLGRWPGVSLEEAREKAVEASKQVAQGKDPREEDPTKGLNFGKLVDLWHEKELVGRKKNKAADATKSHTLHHFGFLKNRPVGTIRDEELRNVLEDIRDEQGKPPTANKLHAHLAAMFKWATKRKYVKANPMVSVDQPFTKAAPRERTWFSGERADDLIKALWAIAGERGGDEEKFIKLLILTGKRRGAVQNYLRWEWVSSDWYWNPPQSLFTPQKRFTPIPLPALAQRILGKRPEDNEGPCLIMSETNAHHLLPEMRKLLEPLGLEDFLWHGLRHIVETKTGEIGVLPHVRDLLLDHEIARSATGRGYDHGAYRKVLAEALETWSQHVEGLVTPTGARLLR